jgi:putative cardiolipin synthase
VYWNSNAVVPFVPSAFAVAALAEVGAERQEPSPLPTGGSTEARDCCLRQITAAESSFVWGWAEVAYDPPDGAKLTVRYDLQHGTPDEPTDEPIRSELLFVSPYFIPSQDGLRHMGEMTRGGLRVAVLTNSLASTDALAAHGGYARYRVDLLRQGVELYEYRPEPGNSHDDPHLWPRSTDSSLHAKLIVVDRRRSIVGSMNQDPRSRLHNTESWVSIESPELAEILAQHFDEGTQSHHSFRVQLHDHALEWSSDQDGAEQRYFTDPLTSPWRRFLSELSALIVPEDLL